MRAFFRPVATLVIAPVLFFAVAAYLRATMTATDGLLSVPWSELVHLYAVFTLPALVLMLVVLLPVDLALRRTGFGLLTVIVSPLVAVLAGILVAHLVDDPHAKQLAAAVWLFFAYGLTWGLTIRDPRTVMGSQASRIATKR